MEYPRKFVGEKCYLSPINPQDASIVVKWSNDLEVGINTGDVSESISLDKQQEYLESLSKHDYGFLIVDNATQQPIGMCKLTRVDFIHRNATLGIFIGDKNSWNKGIGSEAVSLLLDFGFNIINLNNIMLKVFSFNTRAINAYKKCGFKEFGRRRKCVIYGDKKYDDVYMDILAEDFTGMLISRYLPDGDAS